MTGSKEERDPKAEHDEVLPDLEVPQDDADAVKGGRGRYQLKLDQATSTLKTEGEPPPVG
jgi:hypothetical protein